MFLARFEAEKAFERVQQEAFDGQDGEGTGHFTGLVSSHAIGYQNAGCCIAPWPVGCSSHGLSRSGPVPQWRNGPGWLAVLVRDRRAEIFAGQDKGGGQVKVFNGTTGTWTLLKTLKPFGGTYKSGVAVAAGDTDNDGQAELISGRLVGATQVRIHEVATGTRVQTITVFSGLNSGVYLAAGDINGDGRDEVFASLASGNLGLVKVLNPAIGTEINSTLALGSAFTGGLRVGATDRDGDGRAEVLVVAGPSAAGGPRLEVLDGTTLTELDSLFADDDPVFAGGIFVG